MRDLMKLLEDEEQAAFDAEFDRMAAAQQREKTIIGLIAKVCADAGISLADYQRNPTFDEGAGRVLAYNSVNLEQLSQFSALGSDVTVSPIHDDVLEISFLVHPSVG